MMAHQQPHVGVMQGMQYNAHIGPPNGGPVPGQSMPPQMMSGVSGPHGPHVSQAGMMAGMMAGIQPGMVSGGPGMPNAHALSHLTPQVYHRPPMIQGGLQGVNPQHQAAIVQQQQAMLQQRMQAMQQQQQGQPNNVMAMGMPNGVTPGMLPQQMAQFSTMRGVNMPNLPSHLQHQQQLAQQQQQLQQQQQQAAQQQQQQHPQAQHNQMLAQHMAMQHAASQSNHQAQQGNQGQVRAQQQQMTGGHDQQAAMAQQQQAPQQQTQHQIPQGQLQNQQAPSQPPQPGQPQQQQQTAQQQGPQPQGQPGRPSQQQMQQLQLQQFQRQQAQQQNLMRQQVQQGQARMGGNMILKLMQFGDHLSQYSAEAGNSSIAELSNFVSEFFTDVGTLRQQLWDSAENRTKQFEIPTAMLARFFATQFKSGVENIQIVTGRAMQSNLPNNCHYVECSKAKFIYSYTNESQLICSGELRAWFGQNDKLDLLEFLIHEHKEYISRASIEYLFSPESPNQRLQSPTLTKTMSKQNRQQARQPPKEPCIYRSDLPPSSIGYMGVAREVRSYLEIGETFNLMQDLILYSQQNPSITPSDSLQRLAAHYASQSQQASQQVQQHQLLHQQQTPTFAAALPPHMNPANQPHGARTPGLNNPGNAQFVSPAMHNLNLPGNQSSPHMGHTPSPAHVHMQAPGLAAQHSQQGTSSTVGSTNTSPNATAKRRRQSGVKIEHEDGAGGLGEVNGVGIGTVGPGKVKASPRVGGKKQKGPV